MEWSPVIQWSWVLAAYLLGSLNAGILVSRLLGLPDPRQGGSGNPGATNVLRLGGRGAAAATLGGDVLKGVIPVLAARVWAPGELIPAAAALAAFLGHLYPVFFGFRGGKGVATALGGLIALAPPVAGIGALVWLAVAAVFRISSLAALVAAVAAPVATWLLGLAQPVVVATAVMAVLLLWRHRSNIANIAHGKESRIGQKD
ncbi:glycerol-3-phosphate 1-O-acyltransferase PlsY [Thiohalospira sp.]|uniref:glycerol-3-phosphate 1-O-acyltransferase PlsY n=1 Tax=Thiohalospira sp. TaxID=3080549 RepID=UPI00397F9D5D